MADCQVCGSKTGDDGLLCRAHTARLTDELRGVPALLAELDVTISRTDRVTAGAGIGKSAERPLVWNEYAAERRTILLDTLEGWALDVHCLTHPGYVAKAVAALRHDETAGDAYDELGDAARGARRAVDRPDDATRFYAGPCPETVETDDAMAPCPGEVWAFIPTEASTPASLRCRSCKARWGTEQWLRVGQRMLARMGQIRAGRGAHVDVGQGSGPTVGGHARQVA